MTGLIYVAIIAVWAVVLVPAWLRRHDHLDPGRSVDRFSRSMQTLARRPSVLGVPLPSSLPQPQPDAAAEVLRPDRPEASRRRRSSRRADRRRVSPSAWRRAVWALLLVAMVAVAGLVVAGVLFPEALAGPPGLALLFLVVVRAQVRRGRAPQSVRARPVAAPAPAGRAQRPGRAVVPEQTWEPRQTPLPTYVTAPPAAGFPRVIDTTTPGAWTAAAMLQRAQQERTQAERMARAKSEAVARARAEQAAAESRSRDEDFLLSQAAQWDPRTAPGDAEHRRAVNE